MSDCCNGKGSDGCDGGCETRTVLLYACSGAANVAEVADRAARDLSATGAGAMFCLAGLGADVQGMVQTAQDADLNVVIDGCPMACSKKVFDRHGVDNYVQIEVTDLGIDKASGARATDEQVAVAVAEVREVLAADGKADGER